MNKYFKALILIVVFPLLTLLTGCNSEGGFSDAVPVSLQLKQVNDSVDNGMHKPLT